MKSSSIILTKPAPEGTEIPYKHSTQPTTAKPTPTILTKMRLTTSSHSKFETYRDIHANPSTLSPNWVAVYLG